MNKRQKQELSQRERTIAHQYMKRWLTSVLIREILIKITRECYSMPARLAKSEIS